MKLDRRQFLGSSMSTLAMALASRSTGARANGTRAPKNVVVLACFGGWDAASVLDPKDPKDPAIDLMPGEAETTGGIDFRSLVTKGTIYEKAGDQVANFFGTYADNTVVMRGIDVASLAHAACRVRILTGTDDATLPDFAAIAASEIGYDRPLPYIDLGGNGYMGPLGRLVGRFGVDSQITALVDPENCLDAGMKGCAEYAPLRAPLYVPSGPDEAAIANYVLGRAQDQLGTRAKLGYNNDRVLDFIEAYGRGTALKDHRAQLPAAGSFTEIENQVAIVPQLLAGDPLCRTIFLDSRLPWDTHYDNDTLQLGCYQRAFGALLDLVTGIEAEGLLDDTLIVMLSEMGRTPQLNGKDGDPMRGKDHWPTTTALFVGGGLEGNRVLGGTTSIMNARKIDFDTGLPDDDNGQFMMAPDFISTILEYVGVEDPKLWIPDGKVIGALANGA